MIVLIDNFDSFTHNLYQQIQILRPTKLIRVVRNNAITIPKLQSLQPQGLVISPGPGRPSDAGISLDVIRTFAGSVPILGVCLGHQAIAEAFGGKVIHAANALHGKTDSIHHSGLGLFRSLPPGFSAARYHSLVVERESLPSELEVTALSSSGEIMGLRHRRFPIWGIQFHPESFLTPDGFKLMANFLVETDTRDCKHQERLAQ